MIIGSGEGFTGERRQRSALLCVNGAEGLIGGRKCSIHVTSELQTAMTMCDMFCKKQSLA